MRVVLSSPSLGPTLHADVSSLPLWCALLCSVLQPTAKASSKVTVKLMEARVDDTLVADVNAT
jgi:hypothetical protein